MLVSWQILLPTQKHINHSELCGTNRGTVCTQSHNSVGTRHERRWQGEYLFSCSLYFRWMTQTGRFAWAFFGSTSELMYVIKKTKVHVLLNPTAGGLWGRRTTKHVCSISLTTNSNRDKPLLWASSTYRRSRMKKNNCLNYVFDHVLRGEKMSSSCELVCGKLQRTSYLSWNLQIRNVIKFILGFLNSNFLLKLVLV